jgi:hypothetical protein
MLYYILLIPLLAFVVYFQLILKYPSGMVSQRERYVEWVKRTDEEARSGKRRSA